jgi:hypothetical protein
MWSIIALVCSISAAATNAFHQYGYNPMPIQTSIGTGTIVNGRSPRCLMVGGRGWDNSDYLSSLSGDRDDRESHKEAYQEFSDRRAAFLERQEEYLKNSPQAQAFLQQRQQQEQADFPNGSVVGIDNDDDDEIVYQESSGGGTRMGRMMAQAKRMHGSRRHRNLGGAGGFAQKLAVPLDYDEEEDQANADNETTAF